MSLKKSLIAVGTVAAVAVAGTGVAAAQNDTPEPPTAGSAELSKERDVFRSITGADALGSWTNDQLDYGKTRDALIDLAKGAAAITAIAGSYTAVVGASDIYQKTVQDTLAFLASQGIKF